MRYISKVGVIISYTQWYVSETTQDYIYVIRSCTYMSHVGVLISFFCQYVLHYFLGRSYPYAIRINFRDDKKSRLKYWQCVTKVQGTKRRLVNEGKEEYMAVENKIVMSIGQKYVNWYVVCSCVIKYLVLLVSAYSSTSASICRGS